MKWEVSTEDNVSVWVFKPVFTQIIDQQPHLHISSKNQDGEKVCKGLGYPYLVL